ncbi:hypothetical protein GCM10010495_81590 [Kitasatospora herbaricolor]|nr:hypothetical protein GCM10010252_77840 [Streptomyces aureoverticillatus]GGV51783.1 hypothetical protein GCM10010495_81590 [Kitasatospora herbaricolor]
MYGVYCVIDIGLFYFLGLINLCLIVVYMEFFFILVFKVFI